MQSEIQTQNSELLCLMPPIETNTAEDVPIKKRKILPQHILCFICAAVSLFVISVSAFEKLENVFANGILNYITKELLCLEETNFKPLGDTITEVAFGDLEKAHKQVPNTVQISIPLPDINYITKEDIADRIYEEKETDILKSEDLYTYDSTDIPEDAHMIVPTDISAKSPTDIKNETSFVINKNDIEKSAKLIAPLPITNEPLVLIVHTHGTESFSDDGVLYYNDTVNYPRSEDPSKNIVSVGKVLAEELNRKGIPTIHCEIMHDKDSYIKAYERSAQSIMEYLEKYPTIQYVFDVHRDSMIRSDLVKLKPVTLYKGEPCAQIMMIVGSNEMGAPNYDWKGNLILAEAIQQNLFKDASGVARQIYLRGATYNQQHAKHGILIEIGSCGNTLAEAQNAAKAFAAAFADVLQ